MADVFISYSRKDKAFVQRLHGALVQKGKDVWVDWEDIPPTAEWLSEINAAIEAAQVFLYHTQPRFVSLGGVWQGVDPCAGQQQTAYPDCLP